MKERYGDDLNWFERIVGVWRVNRDSFETKWGYFAPRFGLELGINRGGYFDQRYSVDVCLLWGMFNIKLPVKTSKPEGCEWDTYGFNFFEDSMIWRWGRSYRSWRLPFISWEFNHHKVRNTSGEWVPYVYDDKSTHRETHKYTYTLSSGDVQDRKATCYKEVRQWHRKWVPFIKMTKECISIDFNDEVGEESGSWKGGCTSCGYDLLPNESIKSCLRRMERERKF